MRTPAALSDAARALWRFGAERRPGQPKIQVAAQASTGMQASTGAQAGTGMQGVLQVVTDDMPFLVTSIAGALAGMGVGVHLIIQPDPDRQSSAKVPCGSMRQAAPRPALPRR